MSTFISFSIHFLSALPMPSNATTFSRIPRASAEFYTDNLKERKWRLQKIFLWSVTLSIWLSGQQSRASEPEETAVMTDRASSWGRLQQVWVNSLFHGLGCSVPMGTFYQRSHSSQHHLCAIWLTADKHQKHLKTSTRQPVLVMWKVTSSVLLTGLNKICGMLHFLLQKTAN